MHQCLVGLHALIQTRTFAAADDERKKINGEAIFMQRARDMIGRIQQRFLNVIGQNDRPQFAVPALAESAAWVIAVTGNP